MKKWAERMRKPAGVKEETMADQYYGPNDMQNPHHYGGAHGDINLSPERG